MSMCMCVCVCACPGSMTTQWLTISLIEPIHRTSQRGSNTRPHNNLYILYIHVTTRISSFLSLSIYLSLSHSFFHSLYLAMLLSPPSSARFLSLHHYFFISFSPTMNLLQSVPLFFKLTRQTRIAAG